MFQLWLLEGWLAKSRCRPPAASAPRPGAFTLRQRPGTCRGACAKHLFDWFGGWANHRYIGRAV